MAIDLTPEQREIGKANFQRVVGQFADPKSPNRRDFMKGLVAAGAGAGISAAAYFGYDAAKVADRPVKAALIGSGDEGGVLIGEHNPKYLQFIAIADIRPSNQKRIFEGDPSPTSPRKGLNRLYGKDEAKKIKVFESYHKMLAEVSDIEAVVIALPLHLHAQAAIDCMKAGKHVLCEKLMAWNIAQCKEMIRVSEETDRILSIGHQRHYSLLYAHAVEVLNSGVLGDIHHIRALWHRNNSLPVLRDGKEVPGTIRDSWRPDIKPEDREALTEELLKQYGYNGKKDDKGKWIVTPLEELVRWRLFNRTGGGLMAELGSHQLDACSIFLGKVRPLRVSGTGTRAFYREQYNRGEREVDDHVFVTFEFPGKTYYIKDKDGKPTDQVDPKNKDDIVVVTYSSINTNSFEGYGECVMGNRGSLIVQEEREAMLFPERGGTAARSLSVSVASAGGGAPVLSSDPSPPTGAAAAAVATGQASLGAGPPSKGYCQEMEHFAYCIRQHGEASSPEEKRKWRLEPRCHGKVAMADAIMALTSNLAMKLHQPIKFLPEWYDEKSTAVPEDLEKRV
jgi:predicted dehydrogenase